MLRIDFDLATDLTPEQVFAYFRTPHEWPNLFPAFGTASSRPNGWVKVPIKGSPFALTAKVTTTKPNQAVAWDLRGFWRGRGEIELRDLGDGTHITGFEKVSPPRLLGWGGMLERWAEPRFERIWDSGWRRINRNTSGA